ncbi:phosphate ABC transporter substrate-binding protein PstS [Capillimicrobium parvum]|uniref:Phosphate-binding protein n=1 Tax=Capillimicrobium parvum TaxID=2884022 RepID=A0A9E6XVI5_9ACTN|nr:phosphate ABC transporter substrate-binding protein PstS [Capillimicrobium parvum]UGS35186.1 Phosphate-binding protein PstS [Capillimicrobium parvum]
MRHRKLLAVACTGAVALGVAACGSDSNSSTSASTGSSGSTAASTELGGTINGAGATFPQPVYSEWANRFKKSAGTTVNYQGIGSGGGIAQFTEGTVDFGATDAPMTDEEETAAKKKGEPVHVPTVLGAVTVAYNVPGVDKGLKLDGATVANIFLGKVKKWNDPAIAGLNDGVDLPDTAITVCHRSDESGTTKNFTQFLADYSPEWESGPGVDKSVQWPTGTGAKGNDGVAGCVKQTEGSVGYVEQAYALQNNFSTAAIKNKDGQFVEPTLEATSAAGQGASPPADLRFTTINAPGATTYPITAVTFLLVYQDMCKAGMSKDNAARVKAWLDYALGDGQQVAPELEYAPLPDPIKKSAQQQVDGLQCNGSAIATS